MVGLSVFFFNIISSNHVCVRMCVWLNYNLITFLGLFLCLCSPYFSSISFNSLITRKKQTNKQKHQSNDTLLEGDQLVQTHSWQISFGRVPSNAKHMCRKSGGCTVCTQVVSSRRRRKIGGGSKLIQILEVDAADWCTFSAAAYEIGANWILCWEQCD